MAATIVRAIDQKAANGGAPFLPTLFSVADWARTCAIEAQPPFGGKLGFQINARVSKLEDKSRRPAAVTARNPSETKSLLRMVHLPLRILVRIY